jgi:hypothetical protein
LMRTRAPRHLLESGDAGAQFHDHSGMPPVVFAEQPGSLTAAVLSIAPNRNVPRGLASWTAPPASRCLAAPQR